MLMRPVCCKPPTRFQANDASARKIDPTRTSSLRRSFRVEGDVRLRRFMSLLRQAVVDEDMLGLGAPSVAGIAASVQAGGDRYGALQKWATAAIYAVVVERGTWAGDFVGRAYQQGIATAARDVRRPEIAPDQRKTELYSALMVSELEGIADATVQRIAREAAAGVLANDRPAAMYRRLASAVDAVAFPRLHAAINYMVVKAFNGAKLDVYEIAGVQRVGMIAESLRGRAAQRAPLRGDSAVLLLDRRRRRVRETLVEVLTAGDDDVCEECEDTSSDGPYDIETARILVPVHPNCRCAFVPADDERFASVERDDD